MSSFIRRGTQWRTTALLKEAITATVASIALAGCGAAPDEGPRQSERGVATTDYVAPPGQGSFIAPSGPPPPAANPTSTTPPNTAPPASTSTDPTDPPPDDNTPTDPPPDDNTPTDPPPDDNTPTDPPPDDNTPTDPPPDPIDPVTDLRPPCIDNASEVVVIGDSYINWASHSLPADLAALAGQTWRLYAVGGASMASGGIAGFIPDQFENAVVADPNIKAVLMSGGGNDILIPDPALLAGDCKNNVNAASLPACQTVVQLALERAEVLMDRAVEVGVRDVVYFFYPRVPEGTLVGGTAPNAMLEYALPLARDVCEGAFDRTNGALACHFVDMVPVFDGHPDYFAPTDIHPNFAGSAAMADAIWSRMTTECVAQPASSGCCAP